MNMKNIIIFIALAVTFFVLKYHFRKKRLDFLYGQEMINCFNQLYDLSKDSLYEKIEFDEPIEIDIDNETLIGITTSIQARDYLIYLGQIILRYEEELEELYGEIVYDDSYTIFRKNLREVRRTLM